ncbi:hypothetical protein QBC33DRAFT_588832 [Phialemonium atrogriseum]|uniref:Uncharacterized protein n=1 Tax=Phialemonium atrogriseum TaxID=1093897 RepID=A0AAJ0FLF2_9PEZI|nr:uncharacterized protein QBC33DRAFT_588832 [Phialemonium atrogriseum]KAK1766619.1 hypothetical protein QBC33DRAFT_588832 [Phialemonium atrogriseum]
MPSQKRLSNESTCPTPARKRQKPSTPPKPSQTDSGDIDGTSSSTPWKPPKTKKTDIERSINFVGATVPPNLKPKDIYKHHDRILWQGPNGPPVYDGLGHKLSYEKLKPTMTRRRYNPVRHMRYLEGEMEKSNRIREIMGQPDSTNTLVEMAWTNRVARDLDIPFHTVGVLEYEEWRRRGVRLEPGELRYQPSKQGVQRLFTSEEGIAFTE